MSDTRVVVLLGSLRADSLNRRIAETLRDQAPAGTVVEIAEGLGELPFYNEEIDGDGQRARGRRPPARPGRPAPTGCSPSPRSTTARCPRSSTTRSTGSRGPYGASALRGKPFAAARRDAHAVRRQVVARGRPPLGRRRRRQSSARHRDLRVDDRPRRHPRRPGVRRPAARRPRHPGRAPGGGRRPPRDTRGRHERAHAVHLCRRRPRRHRRGTPTRSAPRSPTSRSSWTTAASATASSRWTARAG